MDISKDFYVFDKWLEAPSYAFGNRNQDGVVPVDDREAYWRIYQSLLEAATAARDSHPLAAKMYLRPKPYSRLRGSRGHRPVDLYVSICLEGAEVFGHMPQVYAIASRRGLEIGFAVSIPEADYLDAEAKERNRSIVPFINSKLPSPSDSLITELDENLFLQGGWHFNRQTRLTSDDPGFDQYPSLAIMVDQLRAAGDVTGGGTVARLFSIQELAQVNLENEFVRALDNFAPLLARCSPTSWDTEIRSAQTAVSDLSDEISFDPNNGVEGRQRILTEVAQRQGQAKFRRMLLEAYEGKCAITETNVTDVLQAAHIYAYNGPATNHVTNGILLRADIHNLFDLGLLAIDPDTLRVEISPRLKGTPYWELDGKQLQATVHPSQRPSVEALRSRIAPLDEDPV